LRAWYRCGIQKALAIENLVESASATHCPIGGLAKRGFVSEALRNVKRLIKLLAMESARDDERTLETGRMAELGAKICLDADDEVGCERFLKILARTDQCFTRPCHREWGAKQLREFQVSNGLLDPRLARDDVERAVATYNRGLRATRDAMRKSDVPTAKACLQEMRGTLDTVEPWRKSRWLTEMIEIAAELDDPRLVRALIDSVPLKSRSSLLSFDLFARIGMKSEAVAGAVKEIKDRLAELNGLNDPNVHFPIHGITRALECLIEVGERRLAGQWLKKVTSSASKWKCVVRGWTSNAVLIAFVPIIQTLEGDEAARQLALQAGQHAECEPSPGFRKGARSAAVQAQATVSAFEEPLAAAQKLRSPTQRRMEVAKLLARAGRWPELQAVCAGATTPQEAAQIAWWVTFELPGGEVEA
jgi:hypothetical protein